MCVVSNFGKQKNKNKKRREKTFFLDRMLLYNVSCNMMLFKAGALAASITIFKVNEIINYVFQMVKADSKYCDNIENP